MTSRRMIFGVIFLFSMILVLSACSSKKPEDVTMFLEQDPAAIGKEEPLESQPSELWKVVPLGQCCRFILVTIVILFGLIKLRE